MPSRLKKGSRNMQTESPPEADQPARLREKAVKPRVRRARPKQALSLPQRPKPRLSGSLHPGHPTLRERPSAAAPRHKPKGVLEQR